MGGYNPVVLVALLTAVSLVMTIFKYHAAPHQVPLWWDFLHAHPLLWVPRWFGLFLLPVLTFVVPYALYLAFVNNNLKSHGHKSNHFFFRAITLLPAIFFFVLQTSVLLPCVTSESYASPIYAFVAKVALCLVICGQYQGCGAQLGGGSSESLDHKHGLGLAPPAGRVGVQGKDCM